MKCVICNSYFRQSIYNQTAYCYACVDDMDSELQGIFTDLTNPTGRVAAVFYDRTNDDEDCHGF